MLSEENGKIVGRDTGVSELSAFQENPARMDRESSNKGVTSEDAEATGSSVKENFRSSMLDNVTDKNETVKTIVIGKWKHIRSKFPNGFRKHVVFTCGVFVCIVCCLRFFM